MTELEQIQGQCCDLAHRLDRSNDWDGLRSIYLDLVPTVGRLQGALRTYSREHEGALESQELTQSFEELQATVRQVGHDIRLSSPSALKLGLEACVSQGLEIVARLQKLSSKS